jgi:hypothetical protein
VESGWHGFSEVNRVAYDPGKVTLEELEKALRDAGTYIRTVSEPVRGSGEDAAQ